jgi:hypothetical protein
MGGLFQLATRSLDSSHLSGWPCHGADFPIFNIAVGDYIHSTAISLFWRANHFAAPQAHSLVGCLLPMATFLTQVNQQHPQSEKQ